MKKLTHILLFVCSLSILQAQSEQPDRFPFLHFQISGGGGYFLLASGFKAHPLIDPLVSMPKSIFFSQFEVSMTAAKKVGFFVQVRISDSFSQNPDAFVSAAEQYYPGHLVNLINVEHHEKRLEQFSFGVQCYQPLKKWFLIPSLSYGSSLFPRSNVRADVKMQGGQELINVSIFNYKQKNANTLTLGLKAFRPLTKFFGLSIGIDGIGMKANDLIYSLDTFNQITQKDRPEVVIFHKWMFGAALHLGVLFY